MSLEWDRAHFELLDLFIICTLYRAARQREDSQIDFSGWEHVQEKWILPVRTVQKNIDLNDTL